MSFNCWLGWHSCPKMPVKGAFTIVYWFILSSFIISTGNGFPSETGASNSVANVNVTPQDKSASVPGLVLFFVVVCYFSFSSSHYCFQQEEEDSSSSCLAAPAKSRTLHFSFHNYFLLTYCRTSYANTSHSSFHSNLFRFFLWTPVSLKLQRVSPAGEFLSRLSTLNPRYLH